MFTRLRGKLLCFNIDLKFQFFDEIEFFQVLQSALNQERKKKSPQKKMQTT